MARNFDQILADATGLSVTDTQQVAQTQENTTSTPRTQSQASGSSDVSLQVGDRSMVLELEKTDLMFWMLVIQTVLLALIYLETRG